MKNFLILSALFLACTAVAVAADVTGKWVGQAPGRNGTTEITFNLKADGSKLTGTVLGGGGGRGGNAGTPQAREISDGKIDGANVSFTVKAEMNGQTRVTTYTGTVAGEEIKMKQTREGRNGPQSSEYTLKRSTT
jgi:opacity protein-like surface antigen